jgi:hypothetical protein
MAGAPRGQATFVGRLLESRPLDPCVCVEQIFSFEISHLLCVLCNSVSHEIHEQIFSAEKLFPELESFLETAVLKKFFPKKIVHRTKLLTRIIIDDFKFYDKT